MIDEISTVIYGIMCFGDTDQDGLGEIWMGVNGGDNFTCRALECQPDGSYRQDVVLDYLEPGGVGDFDRDGKSEVVGQRGAVLQIYEAETDSTHPSQLVWQSQSMTNTVGWTTTGDTDRDGNWEIIYSMAAGGSYLVIFENTGDNTFERKVFQRVDTQQENGRKVIADFDGDGLLEVAFCGTFGYLRVFESPADDVWVETAVVLTGLWNAYDICGGADTDGNGIPEIFVSGNPPGLDHVARLYEATGDNTFTEVAKLLGFDNVSGFAANTVQRSSPSGQPGYAWALLDKLHVYHSTAIGSWDLEILPDPERPHTGIGAYDLNQNGRDELYWTFGGQVSFYTSLVLERPCVPTDVVTPDWSPLRISVTPTPTFHSAWLSLPTTAPLGKAHTLSIFDAAGRRVSREPWSGSRRIHLLDAKLLRPGIYFLRLDDPRGTPLATGRATIVQ